MQNTDTDHLHPSTGHHYLQSHVDDGLAPDSSRQVISTVRHIDDDHGMPDDCHALNALPSDTMDRPDRPVDDDTADLRFLIKKPMMSKNEMVEVFRRAARKVLAKISLEKDAMRRVMQGKENSFEAEFHLYIEPYSWKYTMLRYARAFTIFINFLLIPSL